jgi:hypothetical protein
MKPTLPAFVRRAAVATLLLATLGCTGVSAAPTVYDADVLIQAGHEGRPDCGVEPASLCNNTGARGEIELTPVVADQVAKILRAAGVTVIRTPAHIGRTYHVHDAIFIHFDGSAQPCASSASVGYPAVANSRAAAQEWKTLYARAWTFGFEPDNFTPSLRDYYGYKHVAVDDAAIVIEGGELSCPAQAAWLKAHFSWEASSLAYFIARRLHNSNVGQPPDRPAGKGLR